MDEGELIEYLGWKYPAWRDEYSDPYEAAAVLCPFVLEEAEDVGAPQELRFE